MRRSLPVAVVPCRVARGTWLEATDGTCRGWMTPATQPYYTPAITPSRRLVSANQTRVRKAIWYRHDPRVHLVRHRQLVWIPCLHGTGAGTTTICRHCRWPGVKSRSYRRATELNWTGSYVRDFRHKSYLNLLFGILQDTVMAKFQGKRKNVDSLRCLENMYTTKCR